MRALSLLLPVLIAASASAQATGTSVKGVVFDSVAHTVLPGAVVKAALIDSSAGPRGEAVLRVYSASTDASGQYQLDNLPPGRFAIGFQHDALKVLGLEPQVRVFETGRQPNLVMDLAVPAGVRVRASRCPRVGDGSDGMLAGYVYDAGRDAVVEGAQVYITWMAIASVDGKPRAEPRRIASRTDVSGRYLACGLASGTPIGIEVEGGVGSYRRIVGELTIPTGGVVRHDFRLADTSSGPGRGAVTGRVTHENGAPVTDGRVSIPALGIDTPMQDGNFRLSGLPSGTWLVEARVLGFDPQTELVDVVDGRQTTAAPLTLGLRMPTLGAITVIGQAEEEYKVLRDVSERIRSSFGTFFMPGNSWLKSALNPVDVLAAARGFTYLSLNTVRARGCPVAIGARKQLVVYLDGGRFKGGLRALESRVAMQDVLAIEAYSDALALPAKWQSDDACAVVAVWTKK